MNKNIFPLFLCLFFSVSGWSQSMDNYFRKPVLEEGENNIILQNRCGNRLTLMFKSSGTELEFVYKPNANRRKEFTARNFSNRDNQTVLFSKFSMPDIYSTDASYVYDPFLTEINVKASSGAKNRISILNIADENAFVISARSPLLLAIKPHKKFAVEDGLLTEKFNERGEDIISFIKFPGLEQNRFRILSDGTYVLQVLENDVILVGGEENSYQVKRVCKKFMDLSLQKLINRNEAVLDPLLALSKIYCKNPDFNKVLDINKRILVSMVDAGGATFGALSRCYYLIWVRDGSMSTSLMAFSGNPNFIPDWTNLALNSPSISKRDDGKEIPEFGQILGSRWSKSEEDGIFYATLSLFTDYQTTGNNNLLQTEGFRILLESVDRFLDKTWDNKLLLVGSDTRGETSLKSSPYFGYDVVNGEMYHSMLKEDVNYTPIAKSYSLYNQVNTYNLLLMAEVLISAKPGKDQDRAQRYSALAKELKKSIQTKFISSSGKLFSGLEVYADSTQNWVPFGKGCDYWESAWANSLGPYFPLPAIQLSSATEIKNDWEKYRSYGYCPWNTLSRYLYEYGMSSEDYEKMLSEEIRDALSLTKRYPMKGAVTEYQKETEGWRALPFQIGALYYSLTSQLIHSVPMGICVRASNFVDSLLDYKYKLSIINAVEKGNGDVVGTYILNDKKIEYTLQIPSSLIRNGMNKIEVQRAEKSTEFRLYSSTAELISVNAEGSKLVYEFTNPVNSQLVFEHSEKAKVFQFRDRNNKNITYSSSIIGDKQLLELETNGDFMLEIDLNQSMH